MDPSPFGLSSSRNARQSPQSLLRPSSARSRPRPATPGTPTISTDVKVDSRPVTEQGMISMRSAFQGPGRQILDRSYFIGRLRSKKQELQQEIDKMVEQIEVMDKQSLSNVQAEQKQDSLLEDIKLFKLQLADYNVIVEKVNAGMELEDMKQEFRVLKEKNVEERKKVEKLFLERTFKERECNEITERAQLIELEMERKIAIEAPEAKNQYTELKEEYRTLEAELDALHSVIGEVNLSSQSLEQKICESSPTKMKVVILTEQLLSVEEELEKLKPECPSAQLNAEEAREALLSKIRQDNLELNKTEEKVKELEKEISNQEVKLEDAGRFLNELKGGRMGKFIEMQQKEKKMQAFIDNYDSIRSEHEERVLQAQQSITHLLEKISQGITAAEGYDESKANHVKDVETVEHLKSELERHRQELKQLDDSQAKTEMELSHTKKRIAALESEVEQFNQFDGVRADADARCCKLEAEKQKLEERLNFMQGQVKEQVEKIQAIGSILNESEVHKKLEGLKQQLRSRQESNQKLQEDIEMKDRELNYKPVCENIRFMVSQLNTEIKNHQMLSP